MPPYEDKIKIALLARFMVFDGMFKTYDGNFRFYPEYLRYMTLVPEKFIIEHWDEIAEELKGDWLVANVTKEDDAFEIEFKMGLGSVI